MSTTTDVPGRAQLRTRVVRHGVFALVVLGLSLSAGVLRPEGSSTSLWWPAAGASVIGVLLSPRRDRPLAVGIVVAASGLGNLLAGQTVLVSLLFGVCNAAEAAVSTWVLLRGRDDGVPRLRRMTDVGVLVAAVVAGAAVIGLGAGAVVAGLLDGSMTQTAVKVFWSHASAQILLVPAALTPRGGQGEAGRLETGTQWLMLLGCTALVFGPGQSLPISILPVAMLVWAAARGTTRTVLVQMAIFGVAMSLLTAVGGGPFAAVPTPRTGDPGLATTQLVQAYLLMSAFITLTLAATVQERREILSQVTALAVQDALTGVLNRHGLETRMDDVVAESAERDEPFAVALVDVDDFKATNDRFGHLGGDHVLIAVADRLKAITSDGVGLVARLGGDEFVLLLRNVRTEQLTTLWRDAIRTAVERPVEFQGQTIEVGVSIGMASGAGDSTLTDVLRTADAAMYRDKVERTGVTRQASVDERRTWRVRG